MPRPLGEKKRKRQVRLSQTVVPFGVGNIYDFLGESFVACDTLYWRHHGDELRAPRLAKALKVKGFRSAPIQSEAPWATRGPGVPYFRFPTWLFCQTCRRMVRWTRSMEEESKPATCKDCERERNQTPQLVPMRFIIACERGHLGDLPWDRWAHLNAQSDAQRRCERPKLRFETVSGRGAGLDSLIVRCLTCDARNSLKGIASKNSMHRVSWKCPGKQPWEKMEEARPCGETPQVLQRGASNLYYGMTASAIDIPPHSDFGTFSDLTLSITKHSLFRTLLDLPDLPFKEQLIEVLAKEVGCKVEEVRVVLRNEMEDGAGAGASAIDAPVDLETDEWYAFITPQRDADERNRFITKHSALVPPEEPRESLSTAVIQLEALINHVVLATRLREVRTLVSFSRLLPEKTKLRPGLDHDIDWLPAIEVFGEGIFLSLDEAKVRAWESDLVIQTAAAEIERRRVRSLIGPRLKPASPRFLLLHTLAHLVIRQLTFECGYSASSIRERIYSRSPDAGDPQAGILIYTAAGDVEGTLGGLVRQGEPPRLYQTLVAALERGSWCSADPICRESGAQGFEGLNRGACHACSLVAETSCDFANALLDRSFVVGGARGVAGFFDNVLAAARLESLGAGVGA
jgi:hypothetical protein